MECHRSHIDDILMRATAVLTCEMIEVLPSGMTNEKDIWIHDWEQEMQ